MKMRLTELRRIIRNTILESREEDEKVYDDTVLPDEEADEELIAEPDLTDQKERDSYLDKKEKSKKKRDRLRSADEIDDAMADEHAIVGAIGPIGSGNGPGTKPYGRQKKLKSKNAMGKKRRK
jgi:hypothetical protein